MNKTFNNKSFKLGVFLSYRSPEEGGGFTITDDILNSILTSNIIKRHINFIILNDKNQILKKKIIKAGFQCYDLKDNHFLLKIKSFVFSLFPFLLKIYNFFNFNQYLNLQKTNKIDVVWFLSAEYYYPLFSKYVSTVWDLQHITHHKFPETGSFFRKIYRKCVVKNFLKKSYKIITGSTVLIKIIKKKYSINRNKIIYNQHPTPSIFLKKLKERKKVSFKNYFLYPANFWQHKNHLNLIRGFNYFNKKNNYKYSLVLVGDIKDKGHFNIIKNKLTNNLFKNVIILNFVSLNKLINLYDYSLALVYSSFAGPENLPPLEAMARKKQLICSNYPGAKEQLKNIPHYFDPYNFKSIANAFDKFTSSKNDKKYFTRLTKNYVKKVLDEI